MHRTDSNIHCDVAILGAGFAGTLCALLLRQIGLACVVIDKGRHPRFAIGESSTPIGNIILRNLAEKYDMPWLAPFGAYGTWRNAYPDVMCGRKRGFSYFRHEPHRSFSPGLDHAHELLVAANADDNRCDTHWLRADVDHFLVEQARRAGITVLEDTALASIEGRAPWKLAATCRDTAIDLSADFLIDASGPAGILARHLDLPDLTPALKTHSRALFAHFTGIPRWSLLHPTTDHPYTCDDAAVHHCIDDGWMWMLRFADEKVSAGFVLQEQASNARKTWRAAREWQALLDMYPSLNELFGEAQLVDPPGGLQKTARLQRLWGLAAGPGWALLPHAAGFIDPLHSTGIAHSLCGIERLVHSIEHHWGRPSLTEALAVYSRATVKEWQLIDLLVAGCYPAFSRFDLLTPYTMLYFAAATTYEQRRLHGPENPNRWFLCADDQKFTHIVKTICERIVTLTQQPHLAADAARFAADIERAIESYNTVGLFAPPVPNMYAYTGHH